MKYLIQQPHFGRILLVLALFVACGSVAHAAGTPVQDPGVPIPPNPPAGTVKVKMTSPEAASPQSPAVYSLGSTVQISATAVATPDATNNSDATVMNDAYFMHQSKVVIQSSCKVTISQGAPAPAPFDINLSAQLYNVGSCDAVALCTLSALSRTDAVSFVSHGFTMI